MSSPVVFSSGGRAFLFGAKWGTPPTPKALRREAGAAAKRDQARFVAFRPRPAQYALAAPSSGERPRLTRSWYSAAATLADGVKGTILGAWELADGSVWLVAVGRQGILPSGDRLYSDPDQARSDFAELHRTGDFKKIFAPAGWGVEHSRADSLAGLLSKGGSASFRPPATASAARLLPHVVGIVGLLAVSLVGWRVLKKPARPHAIAASVAPAHAVLSFIPTAAVVDACMMRLAQDGDLIQVGGFALKTGSCAPGAITYSLAPTTSLPTQALQEYLPAATCTADGKTCTVRREFPVPAAIMAPALPLGASEIDHTLKTIAESALAKLTFADTRERPRLPGEPETAPQTWRTTTWRFETPAPVHFWAPNLAQLPGAIKTMSFNFETDHWTIEGESYAHP
jgi:hypothetical protein